MRSQALFFPDVAPVYGPHDLRPISDIEPHPSRPFDFDRALNKTFQFSVPEQAILLEKMVARESNVLAIMRCGSGKTWIAMMAAKLYSAGQKTLFILPHSGLHYDFHRRATEMGISCAAWKPNGAYNPDVLILYVAVEYLEFETFEAEIRTLIHRGDLAWIVVDEIHRGMTDIGFREIFQVLGKLLEFGIPIVGLSGTIPWNLVKYFFQVVGIDRWDIIRMSVARPNVVLKTIEVATAQNLIETVVEFAEDQLPAYKPEDRMMIFCQYSDQADKLALRFHTTAFSGRNRATNKDIFCKWIAGDCKVLVGTSLPGTGTDYAHVRDCINAGYPYTMFDLQQHQDRGGRDNQSYQSTTFYVSKSRPPGNTSTAVDLGQQAMVQWATSNRCLRIVPSLFFDGRSTTCILERGEYCGVCLDEARAQPPARPLRLPTTLPTSVSHPRLDLAAYQSARKPSLTHSLPTGFKPTPSPPKKHGQLLQTPPGPRDIESPSTPKPFPSSGFGTLTAPPPGSRGSGRNHRAFPPIDRTPSLRGSWQPPPTLKGVHDDPFRVQPRPEISEAVVTGAYRQPPALEQPPPRQHAQERGGGYGHLALMYNYSSASPTLLMLHPGATQSLPGRPSSPGGCLVSYNLPLRVWAVLY
ncbi:P-loop containing nucleoside triphosphate hydrolase protein [Mycena crocata]|nr:P-loop containing nucleoside triphosphate hydrolase protein [Mycena crocata]